MECRSSGFEDAETLNGGADANTQGCDGHGDVAGFGAVPEEGVRVRSPVDGIPRPAVGCDGDMRGVDMGVIGDEVGSQKGGKEFGGVDGVLFGED